MKNIPHYARVSARSGLDIVFDKEACLRKVNGEEVYAAGFYDPEKYIDNENRLYLAVALSKIEKTSVMDDTVLTKGERTRLLPAFDYSISDFIKKINPSDGNFFKYIPDELLTDEQIDAKASAIEKENAKYRRYSMDEEPRLPRTAGTMSIGQYK